MPNSMKFSIATNVLSPLPCTAAQIERPLNVPTSRYASSAGIVAAAWLRTASSLGAVYPATSSHRADQRGSIGSDVASSPANRAGRSRKKVEVSMAFRPS